MRRLLPPEPVRRDLGDRRGQANAFYFLGMVRWRTGDYPAAAEAQKRALGIYRDLGDRLGQANALNYWGSSDGAQVTTPPRRRPKEHSRCL